MRRLTVSILTLLAWCTAVSAQTPAPLCFRARPRPACSAFLVTNFGSYVVLGADPVDDTPFREIADWGVMVNTSPRDAVGGSVFASLDRLGFAVGPAVRYRRWLPSSASVELGVGTPLGTTTDNIQSGSVLGLVRWSPNDWFALAARPELVRRTVFTCGPTTCTPEITSRGRVSLGAEFGTVPGLVLSGIGAVATLVIAATVAAVGN